MRLRKSSTLEEGLYVLLAAGFEGVGSTCCLLKGVQKVFIYIYIYRERESIHNASTNINFINT